MFTILIAENEGKIKELITQLLRQQGYNVLEQKDQDNVIRIVKDNRIKDIVDIKDSIIKLEDSLYNEKKGILYKSILEMIEKPIIERVLERTEGNQLKAAKILGVNRNTMRAKIKKLGINPKLYKH